MKTPRRQFLKSVVAAGAVTAAAPAQALAREPVNRDGMGMLYDATRCIGCKACMAACKQANDMPPEHSGPVALHDEAVALSSKTLTVITKSEGDEPTFLKQQCMHCVEPGCVSVCIIQAFHKTEDGVVAYDPSRCIGCRYCQIACPFNIPKFEWDDPTPRLHKCELCRHRPNGPACCEVCPRGGVIAGRREELLAEAKRRIAENPDVYVDHVYGEHEAGGTQVLYLSGVPFDETSLPRLDDAPVAGLTETVQHGIYKGFVAPVALYAALTGVLWRQRRLDDRRAAETPADEGGE